MKTFCVNLHNNIIKKIHIKITTHPNEQVNYLQKVNQQKMIIIVSYRLEASGELINENFS